MNSAAQSAPSGADDAKKGWLAQNRRLAAGILAAAVLIFTPIGAWRSLSRAVDRVESRFYTGVDGRGAIAGYIADAENAALGLVATGANYDAASDASAALRKDREALLDVLGDTKPELGDIRAANDHMASSFAALKDVLMSLELSEQDVSDIEYYSGQFDGAQGAIAHAGYNEAAEDFTKDVYNSFPTRLIGSVFGIEAPEQFR